MCLHEINFLNSSRSTETGRARNEFAITIIRNFDLNDCDPRYRIPLSLESSRDFTYASDSLHMSIDAPVTAFVSGEKLKFMLNYQNESNIAVSSTHVRLMKIQSFTSDEPKIKTKLKEVLVIALPYEGVLGNTTKNFMIEFALPPLAPSSPDEGFQVLKVAYEIHVVAIFGGEEYDHILKFPILIGTKALVHTANEDAPSYVASTSQTESLGWNLSPNTPSPLPSAPILATSGVGNEMRKISFKIKLNNKNLGCCLKFHSFDKVYSFSTSKLC